jgi:activating signal cointegrator 1
VNLDNAVCISLWQPWASAIALGLKRYETRSWSTRHRGPLLIHAAKKWTSEQREFRTKAMDRLRADPQISDELRRSFLGYSSVLGCIVAVTDLVSCRSTEWKGLDVTGLERLFGDFSPGRYAWQLGDVVRLPRPVSCAGHQGLWRPSAEALAAVRSQMTEEPCS